MIPAPTLASRSGDFGFVAIGNDKITGYQRGFVRMYLGDNHRPGRPEFIYGTSGAEKG